MKLDWVQRRYDHLYGKLTYRGKPVHGFRSTHRGNPLDTYGRNIYLDTFNSSYGSGWRRERLPRAQADRRLLLRSGAAAARHTARRSSARA